LEDLVQDYYHFIDLFRDLERGNIDGKISSFCEIKVNLRKRENNNLQDPASTAQVY
jgi:hypothetical protein